MSKNIGCPGYIGQYVVITLPNGDRIFKEGDASDEACQYWADYYDCISVRGYDKHSKSWNLMKKKQKRSSQSLTLMKKLSGFGAHETKYLIAMQMISFR